MPGKNKRKCLLCQRRWDGPGSYHPWCKASLVAMRGGKGRKGAKSIKSGMPPEFRARHEARLLAEQERVEREMAGMTKREIDSRGT